MRRSFSMMCVLLMGIAAWSGCDSEVTTTNLSASDVIVYGTVSCGYTTGLMSDLDGAAIPYTFKDIESDPGAEEELLGKIADADWFDGGPVDLPVVDVQGTLLMRPTLEDIEALL